MAETKDAADRNIDSIIAEFNFGKYQIITLCVCIVALCIDISSTTLFVFTTIEPEYRCRITECEDTVYTASFVNEAIPLDGSSKPQKCRRFAVKDTWNSSEVNNCSMLEFDKSKILDCDERVYGKGESIINDFDLGCQEWMPPLVGTVNGVGFSIGLSFVGFLSDKFGRKYVLVFPLLIRGLMGLIQAAAPNYWTYTILEFIVTVLTMAPFSTAYILCAELLSSKHRVMGIAAISLTKPISLMLQGFVAMRIKYWRTFLCVAYAPALLFIICMPIIDESIRWLVIRQRYSDAATLIDKVAHYNNIKFSDNSLNYIENLRSRTVNQYIQENMEKVPFVAIFRSRCLLLRFFVCAFCWITNVLVYYSLNINSVAISTSNRYLNFMLVGGVEVLSILTMYLTADRFGRKICLSGSMVLCGIMCGAYVLIPADMKAFTLFFYLASKFFISYSIDLIYIYTSELFPTTLRHTCLAFCSMVGRVGNILAPQTALMSRWHSSLPMSLFSVVAILSGVSAIMFPETLNAKLPDTIAEAEHIEEIKNHNGLRVSSTT